MSGAARAPVGTTAQNVAALPAVGSLADSAVVRVELRPDAPPSVAALPAVGSLAGAGGAVQAMPAGEPSATDLVCSGAESDEEEQKLLAEVVTAATASDGGGDRAEQPASSSAQERRLRRERRFIEQTQRICRDG